MCYCILEFLKGTMGRKQFWEHLDMANLTKFKVIHKEKEAGLLLWHIGLSHFPAKLSFHMNADVNLGCSTSDLAPF